jgi:hypothetical protein
MVLPIAADTVSAPTIELLINGNTAIRVRLGYAGLGAKAKYPAAYRTHKVVAVNRPFIKIEAS